MRTADFEYILPPELIAQTPADPRDSSRLLVLDRGPGAIGHRCFRDVGDYLRAGDLLIFNDTRVIPARLNGSRRSGGRVEMLLLRERPEGLWEALVRPGRVKPGEVVALGDLAAGGGRCVGGGESYAEAEIGVPCGGGARLVRFFRPELVGRLGCVPLPPYIRAPLSDSERYQTVYARVLGSAAAPTAGLHFTQDLLNGLGKIGVRSAFVTLHIGLDTFRPVRSEDPQHHEMHSEYVEISSKTCDLIKATKGSGGRVVCVGTTSVRTVEAAAARNGGEVAPYAGQVDLFILPGYQFRVADALVTNLHLPRTTLLMLVSSFAGRDLVLRAYHEAIAKKYRFYSFGDAMLIL